VSQSGAGPPVLCGASVEPARLAICDLEDFDVSGVARAAEERMSGVLHLITGLGLGGAESVLVRTVLAAHAAGAPPQIVVSLMDEDAYGADLRAGGIEMHCLGMQRSRPSVGALFRLSRLLRQKRPDVIMSWLYHADL